MFILNGKPLSPDVAFTTGGISYPANWLRLASPEERAAIGITEEPDPAPYDQRFYWGPDLPKDNGQLVEQWVGSTKVTTATLMQPTDLYLARQGETGASVPAAVLTYRASVRTSANTKEASIKATTTTPELVEYVLGAEYTTWPSAPDLELDAPLSNYRIFWDALMVSSVYASIREQSFVNLPMNTLATEFIALIGDAKAGRANEAAIQQSMGAILSVGTFTEAQLAELGAALAAGNLDGIYALS